MKIYKCSKCDKEFKNKFHYNRHLNRKNSCSNMNPSKTKMNPKKITNYRCNYCNNYYSTNSIIIPTK